MSTIFRKEKTSKKNQAIHVILMHISLRTAVVKERLRFSKMGTPQRRWVSFSEQSKNNSGHASPTLLVGSLFPFLPAWLSSHWHLPWGKCPRDPGDHTVFSGVPFRQLHSYKSMTHLSLWPVTRQGNFAFAFSLLCPAPWPGAWRENFVDSRHYAFISFPPSLSFLLRIPPGIPFMAWPQHDATV